MKLILALQLINTWNFLPIEEDLDILINSISYPYTRKKGGYYVFTRPFTIPFTLSIQSPLFFAYCKEFTSVPSDKIISIQLTMRYPRSGDTWIKLRENMENIRITLGFGYYSLKSSLSVGDTLVNTDNPNQSCLEGRDFILKDTRNVCEEVVTLGTAQDISLKTYQVYPLTYSYQSGYSALLPSFEIIKCDGPIPLKVPPGKPYPIWIHSPEPVRYEISCGQTLAETC